MNLPESTPSRNMATFESRRLDFTIVDEPPAPDLIGPRFKPCVLDDHRWRLEVSDGRATLLCENPCSEHHKSWMDTSQHGPMCDVVYEFMDGLTLTVDLPVTAKIVTEYTPGELGGQGDYDAWLEATPLLTPPDEECQ